MTSEKTVWGDNVENVEEKAIRKSKDNQAKTKIIVGTPYYLFNRAARSPQGPGTKSTMDESKGESKTTTIGKETSDIDKWKSES